MEAKIALENGAIIKGKSFGAQTTKVGELVFTTSMLNYVESLTDPSNKGNVLMTTYPLQGNYGVEEEWFQSDKVQVEGFVVKEHCKSPSYYSNQRTINDFLLEYDVPGIYDIDTRALTLKIRDEGSMNCVISTEDIDDYELLAMAKEKNNKNLVAEVSTDNIKRFGEDFNKKVAILDCGIRNSLIRILLKNKIGVVLLPYNSSAETVLDNDIDGLIISSGPGNPLELKDNISILSKKLPIFGFSLGIIGSAFNVKSYKMKFGHRGSNQTVRNLETGKISITSQNHGFTLDKDSLENSPLKITHININDSTVEGIKHEKLDVSAISFYSEDEKLFNDFIQNI